MEGIHEEIVKAISADLVLTTNTLENMLLQQRASFLVQCASRTFDRGRGGVIGVTRSYADSRKAVVSFLSHRSNLAHLVLGFDSLSKPLTIALVLAVLSVIEGNPSKVVLSFLKSANDYGNTLAAESKYKKSWLRRTFTRAPNFSMDRTISLGGMSFEFDSVIRACYPRMHKAAYASLYSAMDVNTRANYPSIERFLKMYGGQ